MEQPVVMITGAAGNLGRAVAENLAAKRGALVCLERNREALAALVARLPSNLEVLAVEGVDLSDMQSCVSAVKKAHERFGRIDALVNTVGGFRLGPVEQSGIDQWDAMMAINARSAYAISAAVLPGMRSRKYGRIVHIAAGAGLKAAGAQAAYAGSKAAVIRLTEALAAENRIHRITANCILPSIIDTPDNRQAMPDADPNDWVPASAIARLIAFLISDEASAVTGASIAAAGY